MAIDKKNVQGTIDELKGHVKEGAGGLTGDRDLEGEGRLDQLKGKVEKGLGNIRQGAKDMLDKAKDKLDDLDRK